MLIEIILEAWIALKRNLTRSFLTMLGIVWGIATVTLLIAYGSSFRSILVHGFDAFGKSVVICWPQHRPGLVKPPALPCLCCSAWLLSLAVAPDIRARRQSPPPTIMPGSRTATSIHAPI